MTNTESLAWAQLNSSFQLQRRPCRGSSAPLGAAAWCAGPHPQLVIFTSVSAAVDGVPVWPSALSEPQRCCHINRNLTRHWAPFAGTTLTCCIKWRTCPPSDLTFLARLPAFLKIISVFPYICDASQKVQLCFARAELGCSCGHINVRCSTKLFASCLSGPKKTKNPSCASTFCPAGPYFKH